MKIQRLKKKQDQWKVSLNVFLNFAIAVPNKIQYYYVSKVLNARM